MLARSSQGTKFFISAVSPISYTQFLGAVSANGPDGETGEIEVTDLSSTRAEYILGIQDEGMLSLDMNYDPAETSQGLLYTAKTDRTARAFKIEVYAADGTTLLKTITFTGLVKSFALGFGTNDRITLAVAIRITGAVTFA